VHACPREAGAEGLDILVIGAPNLGEDPREDVDRQRDWWADQPSSPEVDGLGRSEPALDIEAVTMTGPTVEKDA
jgi:hypothetical protein